MHKYPLVYVILLTILGTGCSDASDTDYGLYAGKASDAFLARNANHVITYNPDRTRHKWHYEQGLMLTALYRQYQVTGDERYLDFIKANIDLYVNENGEIDTYKPETYKLDDIVPGRALLILHSVTGEHRYLKAAEKLIKQLRTQPRTSEGGFWHKKIYPWQMWLDGLYMALPFYGEYAAFSGEQAVFDDIALQFTLMEKHAYNPETGLLFHGWDEKKVQVWADPETGTSSSFWARGIGWYMMALVDVLEILPEDHPSRKNLIRQLNQYAQTLVNYQDTGSKVWYQVIDQGGREGNYLESSATAMYIYSFARGVNMGLLDDRFLVHAREAYKGFLKQFVTIENDLVTINHTCASAGLGGKTDRDGSYEYYLSEQQRSNDCKAIGPFIMASIELHKADRAVD